VRRPSIGKNPAGVLTFCCSCAHHFVIGRGLMRACGSPTARLQAVQAATRKRGSSPVAALPCVWCTQSASPVQTPGKLSWQRPALVTRLVSSTCALSLRQARVLTPLLLLDSNPTPRLFHHPITAAIVDPDSA